MFTVNVRYKASMFIIRQRINLIVVSILIILFPCCQRNYIQTRYKQSKPEILLQDAYSNDSLQQLQIFFAQWSDSIKPYSKSELQTLSDTLRIVLDIYKSFYRPFAFSKYYSEFEDSLHAGIKYAIVQNYVLYTVVDSIDYKTEIYPVVYPRKTIRKRIQDFRPDLDLPGVGLVYLNNSYEKFIKEFLGENPHFQPEPGELGSQYYKAERECRKRQDFLGHFTAIKRGHWNRGWHILSHPVAGIIYITSDYKEAVVSYRNLYEWGRAYLRKINMKWKLIDTQIMMVE